MQLSPNIADIFLLITTAQCFFLTVFILHKYGKPFANKILSAILFLYAAIFLNLFLWEMRAYTDFPLFGLVLSGNAFLVPPLHYLYTLFLTRSSVKFKYQMLFHLVPFIIYQTIMLVSFSVFADYFSGDEAIVSGGETPFFALIINWAITFQGILYAILSIRLISNYSEKIKNLFSSIDKIKLGWLRNITIMYSAALVVFFIEVSLVSSNYEISGQFDFSSLIAAVYVYIIGYMGIFKSEIFSNPAFTNQIDNFSLEEIENGQQTKKYSRSGLSHEKADEYLEKLLKVMEDEKLYCDSELTLGKLSEKIDISAHNLSEIINTKLNQNFFDFVNYYRVEKVKKDLADTHKKNLTLLAIALEAGFNSKSAFNLIFKKQTGLTPSEYKNQISLSSVIS